MNARSFLIVAIIAVVLSAAGAVLNLLHHAQFALQSILLTAIPLVFGMVEAGKPKQTAPAQRGSTESRSLHVRTMEALAFAIEAKYSPNQQHRYMRGWALEIGKELGMSEQELEALSAAALLRDIGKLAVPDHIVAKSGRLTEEECEKLKIHPAMGADILDQLDFPSPVASIVRAHHEKWNGTGYPDGLVGDHIPLGARILSVVDCIASLIEGDAPASVRQAVKHVASLSAIEFDPAVVDALKRWQETLEIGGSTVQCSAASGRTRQSVVLAGRKPPSRTANFVSCITAARDEERILAEIMRELGSTLNLKDTMAGLSSKLVKLIPFDALAVWIREDGVIVPKYTSGDRRALANVRLPLGVGISGWVTQHSQAIVNGDAATELSSCLDQPRSDTALRSMISVPLESVGGNIGALSLYRNKRDGFSYEHLRILRAVTSKLALVVENAVKFQQVSTSAGTDYLTRLPNARSLFQHLERELSRCRRNGTSLAVMLCDLDRFKYINDQFGHLQGNAVLRNFARRLKDLWREYDYVARMGGDEFVIVAPGLTPEAAREKVAQMAALAISVGEQVCRERVLGVSTGLALFPADGSEAEQLLATADQRMYSAKRGKTRHEYPHAPLPATRFRPPFDVVYEPHALDDAADPVEHNTPVHIAYTATQPSA